MKKYIYTKIIEVEPAYRVVDAEGNVRVVTEAAEAKRCGTVDLGYKVRYPDGYESFSPKGAFDDAYHPIDGMNFGLAIEALRKGFRVCRRGWNGKGIFIELQTLDAYSKMTSPTSTSTRPACRRRTPRRRRAACRGWRARPICWPRIGRSSPKRKQRERK